MSDDYYELLEVERTADDGTIKSSYRKLAMRFHPDKNPGCAESEAKFKAISEAYDVLKDPQKRAAYDQYGKAAFQNGGGGGPQDFGGFTDIFENIFGEFMGGGRGRQRGPQRGVARARELAKRIGAPLAIVDKRREKPGEIAEMTVIGNVSGKKCIIVDDICDTAGTLCKAAEVLMEHGATEVHSYITHGVLSGPAVERITNSVMKSLVITDSIEASEAVKSCPNIRIVPTAPMFAQAILNIWNGTSVSSLFEHETLAPIYEGMYSA